MLDWKTVLFGNASRTFTTLLAVWFVLLAFFYFNPQIDIAVATAFFKQKVCSHDATSAICGDFPYSTEVIYRHLRKVLFYLPSALALFVLVLLISSLRRRSQPGVAERSRKYVIALTSFILGPYVLVNLVLKQISYRPRPYETDLFGGDKTFMPAGDFQGACVDNCSFVSGEAAGAGWTACLILLLPPALRPVLGPPLIVISLISPALRTSFGGHYLSDVTLGWLSSLVVYAGVTAFFEKTQLGRKTGPQTHL